MSNLTSLVQLPAFPLFSKETQLSLINKLPSILKPALKLVPEKIQSAMLLKLLNTIFNEAIADGDFEFLQKKWLRIAITDLDLNWWLSIESNKLIMASKKLPPKEDVSFMATGDDLLLIAARKQDPDTLFFQRRLKIEGDTELGLEVKNLIDAIDIEQLPTHIYAIFDYIANIINKAKED